MSSKQEGKPKMKITKIQELGEVWKSIEDGSYADEWSARALFGIGPLPTHDEIRALLKLLDLECSTIVHAEDPVVGGRACRLAINGVDLSEWHGRDIDPEWVEERAGLMKGADPWAGYMRWGQHEAAWISYHFAFRAVCDTSETEVFAAVAMKCSRLWHAGTTTIVAKRIHHVVDAQWNLHNAEGPAAGPWYALQGLVLPAAYEWVVRDRDTLDRERIDTIDNAEIRRVVIASYPGKYISGPPLCTDDRGALYDLPGMDYRVVRVKDSYSPRVYWLRVPPDTLTPQQGIASTFGLKPEQYTPDMET